jgi:prepilin-type N-terminal cleavage/methylation domain-containing protein
MTPRGFTLIESTVAAVLIAAGILLVLGADRNVRLLGRRSADHLRAVEAAASSLDSARSRCQDGVPVSAAPVSATVPAAGRAVHVETRLACAAP